MEKCRRKRFNYGRERNGDRYDGWEWDRAANSRPLKTKMLRKSALDLPSVHSVVVFRETIRDRGARVKRFLMNYFNKQVLKLVFEMANPGEGHSETMLIGRRYRIGVFYRAA